MRPSVVLESGSGAGVAQLAERQPSKLHVAGSNPVSRSTPPPQAGGVSDLSEAGRRFGAAIGRTVKATPDIAVAATELSARYRSRSVATTHAVIPVKDLRSAAAYAIVRAPATFAAASRALLEAARAIPSFDPRSLLDVGAGNGATGWAAAAMWPTITGATLVEAQRAMIDVGRRIAADRDAPTAVASATWSQADVSVAALGRADVVTAAYILGELPDAAVASVVRRLWSATDGVLVLVEPGSPAGFARILSSRAVLIAEGARIAAPCPGNDHGPLANAATWCHFLARLDRTPGHRRAKAGARSWEDEPYSYVVATRLRPEPAPRVVAGRPRHRPGMVELRICSGDGRLEQRIVSRHARPAYATARDLRWGDRVPRELTEG